MNMNYQPPGSKFPPQVDFQDCGHAATESTSLANYAQWVPITPYELGTYPSVSVVQAYGNITPLHSDGIVRSQMALQLESAPDGTVAQSHQLSDSTSDTNVQLVAPPTNPRKRKAPTLRPDNWEPVKARLIELHINQKRPLPEVKQIVEEEFKPIGFTAT